MRLLAIGDIHGCYNALRALEEFVPITRRDLVVTLGDYVDRGPNSREVVEWVMARTQERLCIPLRGNHEIMMLDALQGRMPMIQWLQYGGDTVLKSYSGMGTPNVDDIPLEHLRFLAHKLVPWHETAGQIFVHATVHSELPLSEQEDGALFWERFEYMAPHASGKLVICGHTAQRSGVPLDKGFAVCIDTHVYASGWLTCLDVNTGDYWQANQAGQTRTGRLSMADTRPAHPRSSSASGARDKSLFEVADEDKEQGGTGTLDWLEES